MLVFPGPTVTWCHLSRFFLINFDAYSIDSPKMIGNPPEVFNSNQLFLILNQFICNRRSVHWYTGHTGPTSWGPHWPVWPCCECELVRDDSKSTGWWWRDTQISRKRLAVRFLAMNLLSTWQNTCQVVNYLMCFGVGMSAFCLNQKNIK